ncbi:MAG: MarR family transcriptional regulator [Gammaproteobacteria bacterium]|jgi:DNA-binding MarR family transcriptional regulator
MIEDSVDKLVDQWREERPELDMSGLGLVVRVELLAKRFQKSSADALAELGLKTWEYDVLSALRRQGAPYELPVTELARSSLLTTGTVTTRIDQLEARGLVRRRPDPDDRRGVRISLTSDGVSVVNLALNTRLRAAESSLAGLSTAKRDTVNAGLRRLMFSLEN